MTTKFRLNTKIVLFLVLALATVLRLYKLDSVPPSLTPDEASLGYNAYSILKTGKDEHGEVLPVVFKSFGDHKPGLYIYTAVPSIALFGLNEFSVRLPGALFGIISVLVLYFVAKELFVGKKHLPLLSAFFLAVSPWHMFFSRGAWEINLSLMLTLMGIYFFLRARSHSRNIIYSAIFFSLTLLSYQGAKLSTAIVIALLCVCYLADVRKIKIKYVVGGLIVGAVIATPIVLSILTGRASRLAVFNVFSAPRPVEYLSDFLNKSNENVGDVNYLLFHSESFNFLRGILGRWFNHFSARFLFFEGDWASPRHSAPYSGELLLMDLPLLIVGLLGLIKDHLKKEHRFILIWLAIACLPSILSRDQIHAVRSYNMVIPLTLVISFGFYIFWNSVKKKGVFLIFIALYLFSFIYYLDAYFVHLPKINSKYWEYGYKQLVQTITKVQNDYPKIIFQQSYAQPYIYFLFYRKYDPAEYQKVANQNYEPSKFGDVGQILSFENISFEGIDWQIHRGKHGLLLVADIVRIPITDSQEGPQFHIVDEVRYLDNNYAFRVIEVKK